MFLGDCLSSLTLGPHLLTHTVILSPSKVVSSQRKSASLVPELPLPIFWVFFIFLKRHPKGVLPPLPAEQGAQDLW